LGGLTGVQGFVEFDGEDDDNFGGKGHVARKEKVARRKEVRFLSGNAARELLLECIQLVLRKQVAWLIKEQRFPSEYETVVRDLWDLRLRNFQGLKLVTDVGDDGKADGGAEYETDRGTPLFSSQPDSELSDATKRSADARSKYWKYEKQNSLPNLLDTLGLLYLGGLLLRLPYRVADFHRWAKTNQLLFLDAVCSPNPRCISPRPTSNGRDQIVEIPKPMLERLPTALRMVFMARKALFKGGEVHKSVQDLVRGYHRIYRMEFPGINGPPVLQQYVRELSLSGKQ